MTDADMVRLAATKVMGWTKAPKKDSVGEWWEDTSLPVPQRYPASPEWNPLTSIADAWMLVEEVGKHFSIELTTASSAVAYVGFMSKGDGYRGADAHDNSVCRAITVAALRVVGVVVD